MDEYGKLDNLDNERGAGYTLFAIGESCSFFVAFRLKRCRSPPLFNLNLKNKLNGGKEKWQNAQKEENIGITHIF